MRESRFIERNRDQWHELEKVLAGEEQNPESLRRHFIRITDDLSFARSRYPNRFVLVFLNNLAQRLFLNISNRQFWSTELPLAVYQARNELILSCLIFLIAAAIGVVSSIHDPEFARFILGDNYVSMTKENIESGDAMKVYKEARGFDMFLGITVNNIFVAFYTFILGLFMAVGTFSILLYNGIMIGAFQYFFIERDLFRESFLTIWMHGTWEITSIIIAGAAGLVLGKGILFPRTYPRLQSMQLAAFRALKIFSGTVPFFIAAAFIESFFTRATEVPDLFRILIIVASFTAIIYYFILYPLQVGRRVKAHMERALPAVRKYEIPADGIRSNGEIFGDIFFFAAHHFKKLGLFLGACALVYTIFAFFFFPDFWRSDHVLESWSLLRAGEYFQYHSSVFVFLSNVVASIAVAVFVLFVLERESMPIPQRPALSIVVSILPGAVISSFLIHGVLYLPVALKLLMFPFILPTSLLWLMLQWKTGKGLRTTVASLNELLAQCFFRILALQFLIIPTGLLIYFLLDSGVLYLLLQVIHINWDASSSQLVTVYVFAFRFAAVIMWHLLFALLVAAYARQLSVLNEITSARLLLSRIETFRS
jgi:uncharacterized membrane protein SpoIIM required for sporulation